MGAKLDAVNAPRGNIIGIDSLGHDFIERIALVKVTSQQALEFAFSSLSVPCAAYALMKRTPSQLQPQAVFAEDGAAPPRPEGRGLPICV